MDWSALGSGLMGGLAGFAAGGPFGAVLGAGAGLASAAGAHQSNQWSADMAREQMQFQERMSSTAHQRQVADLRAAGLNPILSANSGAQAPGGAMGAVQNEAQVGIASALEMSKAMLDMKMAKENIGLIQSQKRKNEVDAKVAERGIPQSEAINAVWDELGKPLLNKVRELKDWSAMDKKKGIELKAPGSKKKKELKYRMLY